MRLLGASQLPLVGALPKIIKLSDSAAPKMRKKWLYCHCNQPNDQTSTMIACDQCKEWYHATCVRLYTSIKIEGTTLSDGVFKPAKDAAFVCQSCTLGVAPAG